MYLLTDAIFIWILQVLKTMGFIESMLVFCNTLVSQQIWQELT